MLTNEPADPVVRQIHAWKDALIDLTRRNPLVSLSLKAKSNLRIPELSPDELYALLTQKRKSLLFMSSVLEAQPFPEVQPSLVRENPGSWPEKSRIRTGGEIRRGGEVSIAPADLKALNTIRQRAALAFQEQGLNTLFVAIGLLEWPDPQTKVTLFSPLLLVPVTLERTPGSDPLRMRRFDDDVELNPTLRHRLSLRDVQAALPELPEEDDLVPSRYLDAVEAAIIGRADWHVRRECYIGRFSFLKLVMYKDLEALAGMAREHPVVAALAGDKAALQRLPSVTVPPEGELDEATRGRESFQVLDADPSQQRAVLAARDGQSFVLQGPPGTGKTQTIANIITECIAAGKRVLFVSQKMAALDAVFKRLRDKGLADLCLEAHSHKATKKEVLDQLGRALDARTPPDRQRRGFLEELAESRGALNAVAAELHRPREPLGLSLYEANGQVALAADVPDLPFIFVAAEAVSAEGYSRLESMAQRLAAYHPLFAEATTHPWRGFLVKNFSLNLQTQVRVTFGDLLGIVDRLEHGAGVLAGLCGLAAPPPGFVGTDRLLGIAQAVMETPCPPESWLTTESVEDLSRLAGACCHRYDAHQSLRTSLLARCRGDVLSLPVADLRDRLLGRHDGLLRPALGEGWHEKVRENGAEITALFSSLAVRTERLRRGITVTSQLCGLPATDTASFGRYLLRVAGRACTDPKPQPAWFDVPALSALVRQADEARAKHEGFIAGKSDLFSRFSEEVLQLDLPLLIARLRDDYATFLRYFKPGFYRDRRLIRASLQPGILLPPDLVRELSLAQEVREGGEWIQAKERGLEEAFGIHYRGLETDWNTLRTALRQIEELAGEFPGRQVPSVLQSRLVASGPEVEALADLRAQLEAQFTAVAADVQALRGWRGTDDLPFTDQPFTQAPLEELWKWARSVQGALDDHLAARAAVTGVNVRVETPLTAEELAAELDMAQRVAAGEEEITAEAPSLSVRFSAFYQGLSTDWSSILTTLEWCRRLRALLPEDALSPENTLPARLVNIVTVGDRAVLADIASAQAALSETQNAGKPFLALLPELFAPERLQAAGKELIAAPYPAVYDWLQARLDRLSDMERWIGFQALREECAEAGLLSFFDTTTNRVPPAAQVVPAFRRRFHRLWLDSVADGVPVLRQFRGEEHALRIARFGALDLHQIDSAPTRVHAAAASRRPAALSNFGEVGALRLQLRRKRPKPIRKLLQDIPNLLFSLKPCLMMSPLTVSLFLDPEKITFDIVIFDEASQLFVQDAVGALLRAKQVVIAGDTKQLPPTSFFMNLQEDGEEDEDESESGLASAGEFESVLKAADALAIEQSPHFALHPLRWHYRSRHESLIAFSRKHFYETLITSPSVSRESAVTIEHVPEGIYWGGKGGKRDNPIEAVRVADLVIAQIRADPEQSVGVITFSEAQQQAIRAEIDLRKRDDLSLESLLSEEGSEGFFVKNIENVQGDERDVIFLSVGYGRDSLGNLYMRFGPLNTEGGDRRLNVAITRARRRCTVVTSLLPQDIVSDRTGPRLLRAYLELAQGGSRTAESTLGRPASVPGDFERAVQSALMSRGHDVRPQVGLFDYRMDLAVVDPSDPDRFLIGIECDGAMYQRAETARARDRLRPDVLRGLGWRLVRLWSGDWVRDPVGEIDRLEDAIARALRGEDVAPPRPELPVEAEDESEVRDGTVPRSLVPQLFMNLPPGVEYYERAALTLTGTSEALYDEDDSRRAQFLRQLVEAEGPVALEAAVQRLADAAGITRAGSRVRAAIDDTVEEMARMEAIDLRDGFLWLRGSERPAPRVPRERDVPRPVEQVCREEIGELVVALLKVAFGMRRDELITETARLLGYRSTGVNIRDRINDALSLLELDNRIHVQGGQVRALELD